MEGTTAFAGGVCLRQLFPDAQFFGGAAVRIQSCTSDSRQCRPGDLFVALVGSRHDGHEYAGEAIRRGAIAILAERPLPLAVPTCIVDDTRVAFGRLCQAIAGDPSRQLRVVGVGGSSGKTTTAMLTAAVLEAAGHQVGIMGSLGFCDAMVTAPAGRPLPAAPELADWLARMTLNGCSHAVLEASSHALLQRRLAGVQLDAAIVTNVRRPHANHFGSALNNCKAKGRLLDHLRPDGVAVINADDPASTFLLSHRQGPTITVAHDGPGELTATIIERHKSEQMFLLTAGSETIPVRTRLIGDHQVYNFLGAAAVGLVAGIDLETVVKGLESVAQMPGRLERIECGQEFGTFVDMARTPESLSVSLRTLKNVTSGRLICVFGAPGGRNRDMRPLLGQVAERYADLLVITSDNPAMEKPLEIAHDIFDGCRRPGAPHVVPDRAKAIQWALSEAKPGDTVLVAGKGCEPGQHVGCHVYPFDDRETVRYCLLVEQDRIGAR